VVIARPIITPSACADVKPSLVRLARSTYVGALLSFVGRVESLAFGGDACGSVSGGAISVIAERCFDSFAGDSNLAVREAVVTAEPAALDVDGMKSRQVRFTAKNSATGRDEDRGAGFLGPPRRDEKLDRKRSNLAHTQKLSVTPLC
jgi:hypothetical protein